MKKDFLDAMAVTCSVASFMMMFITLSSMTAQAMGFFIFCVSMSLLFFSLSKREHIRDKIRRDRRHFEWRKKCGIEQ